MNKNIFVISDTWFNRPINENASMDVTEYNNKLISEWNDTIKNEDIVYVLGGFGISDLYSIVIKLNGQIHFLNNFYTDDEKYFRDVFRNCIINSVDKSLTERIILEDNQIISLNDEDVIMSYFPLSYWYGKDTGTLCFHGLDEKSNLKDGNISCCAFKTNFRPFNIKEVKEKISIFSDIISE